MKPLIEEVRLRNQEPFEELKEDVIDVVEHIDDRVYLHEIDKICARGRVLPVRMMFLSAKAFSA